MQLVSLVFRAAGVDGTPGEGVTGLVFAELVLCRPRERRQQQQPQYASEPHRDILSPLELRRLVVRCAGLRRDEEKKFE